MSTNNFVKDLLPTPKQQAQKRAAAIRVEFRAMKALQARCAGLTGKYSPEAIASDRRLHSAEWGRFWCYEEKFAGQQVGVYSEVDR